MTGGVLLLDKPPGVSSAGALTCVKRRLNCRKIGHAGTLDPLATGLLICLIGGATRLAQFATAGDKEYTGAIELGLTTDTDDIAGRVLSRSEDVPSFDHIQRTAAGFTGEIEQLPPQVSALKVNGVRGYELARRGVEVTLERRRVRIEEFTIAPLGERQISFRVACSKGTYIRAIARDLGAALGCGACVAELRRTASRPYTIADAKELDAVTPDDIMDWSALFPEAGRLRLTRDESRRLQSGDERTLSRLAAGLGSRQHAIYGELGTDEWLGLLVQESGTWRFGVNIG